MILNFSVTNYRIFHSRTTLSMEPTKDRRLQENTFSAPDGKITALKLSAVYGANASGKTTMFQALNLFINFIRNSMLHTKDSVLNYTPFAFTDRKEPTSLECEFISNGIRYAYGFSYDRDSVTEEHLYSYPNSRRTVVFERNGDTYTFKSDVRFRKENSRRVGGKSLYVSVCAQFNDRDCMNVSEWAARDVLVMVDYDVPHSLDVLTSLMRSDKEFRKLALRSFGIADLGITNVHDKGKDMAPAGTGTVVLPIQDIWVKHSYNGVDKELPLASESAGTIRFLSVIGPVIDSLRKGITIVVDEIDMSFHTDLCRWIAGLFLDPSENRNNAQLILNTNDVSLLDQSLIRRDQIYFSVKDWKSGEGELRRLSDYGIRNDLDIRKAYLNGSFGGRPFIAPDKLMEKEEDQVPSEAQGPRGDRGIYREELLRKVPQEGFRVRGHRKEMPREHPDKIIRFCASQVKDLGLDLRSDDMAFCVFDVDFNSEETVNRALEETRKKGMRIIMSNPCFEVFFLMHFTGNIDCLAVPSDAKREIGTYLPDYSETEDYWKKLLPHQAEAVERSRAFILESKVELKRLRNGSNIYEFFDAVSDLEKRIQG